MLTRVRPVLLALLAAIAATPASGAERSLAIGISQYPSTLHPNIESMLAKSYVLGFVHRPITTYDHDWALVCMLCETLPTIENGLAVKTRVPDPDRPGQTRDGIDLTYTLKPGLTWGDGTPVTTEDVRFTWELGRHAQAGVSNFELYRRIPQITVHDARRFTLHADKLTYAYNAINDFRLVPAHLERTVLDENPAEYRNRTLYLTDPTRAGLWLGPYRPERVTRGVDVVLRRNPAWSGPAPQFDQITVRIIENSQAMEAAVLTGRVDMVAGELGLRIDSALDLERRHGDRLTFLYKPGLAFEHIDLNLGHPALADARVRHALLLGIDRERLAATLFGGRQEVARTMVHPLDWVFDPALPPHPYDPAEAARLLDAAGWPLGSGKIRRRADGTPLRLELMTTAGDRTRELVQQTLQSAWHGLGIEVPLRNQPARVFFGDTVSKRAFAAMAMFAWLSSPENVPRTTLHSEQIPSITNNWGGQNYSGFKDAETDRLIEAIEIELDRDKRKALWAALQRRYTEQLPSLPLFYRSEAHVLPKWLSGLRPSGHQAPTSLWVEDWKDGR